MQEQIKFPDFKEIIKQCKKQMKDKFADYGNSWDEKEYTFGYTPAVDNDFWESRLKTEVLEFLESDNLEKTQKELIDIINIASMIYEKCKYYHDPNWRYG